MILNSYYGTFINEHNWYRLSAQMILVIDLFIVWSVCIRCI